MKLLTRAVPLLLSLAAPAAHAATLHVPADYPTIPEALDAAQEGDTVLVAAGTYSAEVERDFVFTDPPEAVTLRAGGFLPPGVTLRSADGPEVTTIAVSSADLPHCLAAALGKSSAPSQIVGFRFERVLTGAAAILAREMPDDWTLTVADCVFEELHGGLQPGGFRSVSGGRARFVDCTFSDVNGGPVAASIGSIVIEESSSPTVLEVHRCAFSSKSGIGMASGASLVVTRCTFTGNGLSCGISSAALETTVEDCRFASCGSYYAVRLSRSGSWVGTIRRCTFTDGAAAAYVSLGTGSVLVEDCWFERCTGSVGAIRISGAYFDNSAVLRGNVFLDIESSWGAVYWNGVSGEISGNTFFRCHDLESSDPGAAIQMRSALLYDDVDLRGNIFAGSSGSPAVALGLRPNLFDSCNAYWDNPAGHTDGFTMDVTSFVQDPLFCDPEARILTLSSLSPCLPGNHPGGAACGPIGALPVGCGPVSIERMSWGEIKARWRDGR